jgi:hypothetical protein
MNAVGAVALCEEGETGTPTSNLLRYEGPKHTVRHHQPVVYALAGMAMVAAIVGGYADGCDTCCD